MVAEPAAGDIARSWNSSCIDLIKPRQASGMWTSKPTERWKLQEVDNKKAHWLASCKMLHLVHQIDQKACSTSIAAIVADCGSRLNSDYLLLFVLENLWFILMMNFVSVESKFADLAREFPVIGHARLRYWWMMILTCSYLRRRCREVQCCPLPLLRSRCWGPKGHGVA